MKNKLILLTLAPITLCCSCATTGSTNIDSYSKLLESSINNSDFHTDLYIFPRNTNIGTPKNFSYKRQDDLLNGSYFFYLVMNYDEATFNNELERLDKIEGHFSNGESKPILHYEEESIYLTIDRNNCYEYVKYDKQKLEIAYISNQLFSNLTAKVSEEHSLPKLTIPSNLDDGNNSYNMYYFYYDEPDGLGGTIHVGEFVTSETQS